MKTAKLINVQEVVEMSILGDETTQAPPAPPAGGGNAPAPAKKNDKAKVRDELYDQAVAELGGEENIDFSKFGAKAETLTFIKPLGRDSKKSNYTDRAKKSHACPDVVGGRFVSSEPISIPRAPMSMTHETGIDFSQVTWEEVAAGQNFDLSLIEAVILLTQEEYSLQFMYEGKAGIAVLSARFTDVGTGGSVLPTPFFAVKDTQIKADQIVIDEQIDGVWVVKEGFERFGELVVNGSNSNTTVSRGKKSQDVSVKTTLAFKKLMNTLKTPQK